MTETAENKTFNEIQIGDAASLTRALRPEDVEIWAAVTGNPNLLAEGEEAAPGAFGRAGGGAVWAAALVSEIIGTRLPGAGSSTRSVYFDFAGPVPVGTSITATATVKEKNAASGTVGFIANRKATAELLPHLVRWQQRHGYPVQFACEATLNIAKQESLLELMRSAGFVTIFVGIETPEIEALKRIDKGHNVSLPMLEAVRKINSYGVEVVSGIILGLDTDTPETPDRLLEFVEHSRIPVLTINLLQALPRTPLWERLSREDRLVSASGRESNVRFLRPYEEVVASWRRCVAEIYRPRALFDRFIHQVDATYPNRLDTPVWRRLTLANLRRGLTIVVNLAVLVGVFSEYRREFWRAARHCLGRGQIQSVLSIGLVAHHLIRFSQEAVRGEQNASFYAPHSRTAAGSKPRPLSLALWALTPSRFRR